MQHPEPTHNLEAKVPVEAHVQNFFDCVKSRKEPNAPVEVGASAVSAPHLANLAFHQMRQVKMPQRGVMVLCFFGADVAWIQGRLGVRRIDRELTRETATLATVLRGELKEQTGPARATQQAAQTVAALGRAVAVFDESGTPLTATWNGLDLHGPLPAATAGPVTWSVQIALWRVARPRPAASVRRHDAGAPGRQPVDRRAARTARSAGSVVCGDPDRAAPCRRRRSVAGLDRAAADYRHGAASGADSTHRHGRSRTCEPYRRARPARPRVQRARRAAAQRAADAAAVHGRRVPRAPDACVGRPHGGRCRAQPRSPGRGRLSRDADDRRRSGAPPGSARGRHARPRPRGCRRVSASARRSLSRRAHRRLSPRGRRAGG